MDTRRLAIALGAAFAISILVTSVFYVRISRQAQASRSKTRQIVAAATDIQAGVPVAANQLTMVNWPESVPLQGLVENKDDVTGHVLIYPIAASEPLLKHDLAAGASFGLTAKIPDGMRATAVKVNEVNNVAGFIFPGCRVDVLVTMRGDASSTYTRTVLQNVQVLSTGTKIQPDPSGKPENVNVITLLVTPEDSEKLVLAQSQGAVQFVLRNGGDSAQAETRAIHLAELAGAPPVPEKPVVEAARVVRKKAPVQQTETSYSVETIAGGKATVTKFEQASSRPE